METWSLADYREYLRTGQPKKNKYNANPCEYDGYTYDSKREAEFAQALDLLMRAGEVSSWERQVPYSIDINGKHICKYVADFKVHYHDRPTEVIDVKSVFTAKLPVYRLKKKLMEAVHGIVIREVL